MGSRPKIIVSSASVKSAELQGQVTVGEETAAKLGVPVGTVIDLGTLAYYNDNIFKRWLGNRKVKRRHALS